MNPRNLRDPRNPKNPRNPRNPNNPRNRACSPTAASKSHRLFVQVRHGHARRRWCSHLNSVKVQDYLLRKLILPEKRPARVAAWFRLPMHATSRQTLTSRWKARRKERREYFQTEWSQRQYHGDSLPGAWCDGSRGGANGWTGARAPHLSRHTGCARATSNNPAKRYA
jgi:hypothetical protein